MWQDQIADCFAEVDQSFVGDKTSSDHAFAMVAQMRAGGVPWGEARDIFKEHWQSTRSGSDTASRK